MEKETERKELLIGINERPKNVGKWVLLSLQHVFAMFGATVLVPILTGLDIGVALVASGIGTFIYIAFTKAKSPVYLGSSFAYIPPITAAVIAANGATPGAAYVGLMLVGIVYVVIAVLIHFLGTKWINKLLPPYIIGPAIMIIGFGLAGSAVANAGLNGDQGYYSPRLISNAVYVTDQANSDSDSYNIYYVDDNKLYEIKKESGHESVLTDITNSLENSNSFYVYSDNPLQEKYAQNAPSIALYSISDGNINVVGSDIYKVIIVAVITLLTILIVSMIGSKFMKVIPFLFGIVIGYLSSLAFGLVDFTHFENLSFFALPNFTFVGTYSLDFSFALSFIPLAFVTICEHIGDHTVLSEITGKDLLKDPGLSKTLLGDGVATFVSAAIGGPANTTYGENTGVIAITKVGSVWVIGLAALIAIILGFIAPIQAFIASIPNAVLGGMTLILYGMIGGNGVKVLIKNKVDLGDFKNLVIVSVMLVLGLGGAVLGTIPGTSAPFLSGMSIAIISGILLNLLFGLLNKLQKKEKATEESDEEANPNT